MPDPPAVPHDASDPHAAGLRPDPRYQAPAGSLRSLGRVLRARKTFVSAVVGGLVGACLLYCLFAPNQYEAVARVAVSAAPAPAVNLAERSESAAGSYLAGQAQLETVANVFRSDRLAWQVIVSEKLYQAPGFAGGFASRFRGFQAEKPSVDAQAWLLERFHKRLHVMTLPTTLIVQIRFRSRDAALSAAVVNALIRAYDEEEAAARIRATAEATRWLNGQMEVLAKQVEDDDRRLAEFQKSNRLVETPETLANGQSGDVQHTAALLEIDELQRELVAATAERLLREAEYRAASQGDPELVAASDPRLQSENAAFGTALLNQLHTRRSELEEEQSQLGPEHGPNFPRAEEIRSQLADLDRQISAEDKRLVEGFRDAWKTASDREQLVQGSLEKSTNEGMKANEAAFEFEKMRREAQAAHELYVHVTEKAKEAGLSAGVGGSSIYVVDDARQPVKPVAPDPLVYLAITFFVSAWLAIGGALLLESLHPSTAREAAAVVVVLLLAIATAGAQAPTPNTSGLPSGVTRIPQSTETRNRPNAREAPAIWNSAAPEAQAGAIPGLGVAALSAAPIGPGDILDISEVRTQAFRVTVRVTPEGTVTLPLAGQVALSGKEEEGAAQAIESQLVVGGMLRHPQITVLVLQHVGQDVSVLGEVAHPGVYPYTVHHRLLDLIAAASGLSPAAGTLVTITHRNEERSLEAVRLDSTGAGSDLSRNPELDPGDTVEVSRAGLVYVIGDVLRPGGFPVDPAAHMTLLQALTLAWGPSQNAALTKALLIREQKDGRTVTSLNLKRLLRGQDPDLQIEDRDILFVPDSAAKNLWNRSMESVVQSAAGVSIYSGLVYSQRF